MSDKIKYQAEADKTTFTIDLAHRLVNGLGSEAVRWHQSVDKLRNQITKLPGDVLFIASFVSYAGCFTRRYRMDLLDKMWKPTFLELKVSYAKIRFLIIFLNNFNFKSHQFRIRKTLILST